jgi:hypothetical protein
MSESREDERSPYLQPTYQSLLINALNGVLMPLMENRQMNAYFALKAAYAILPKPIKDELKTRWEQYIREVHSFSSDAPYSILRQDDMNTKLWRFLVTNNYELYGLIKDLLEKHKYLKFDTGAKPQIKHKQKAYF